jgi:hypothetical protein
MTPRFTLSGENLMLISTGDVPENEDGRLVCYGYGGTRKQVPPECHHNPECDKGEPRLSP